LEADVVRGRYGGIRRGLMAGGLAIAA